MLLSERTTTWTWTRTRTRATTTTKTKTTSTARNENEKMTRQRLCLKRFFFEGEFGVESAGIAAVAFMRFAHTKKLRKETIRKYEKRWSKRKISKGKRIEFRIWKEGKQKRNEKPANVGGSCKCANSVRKKGRGKIRKNSEKTQKKYQRKMATKNTESNVCLPATSLRRLKLEVNAIFNAVSSLLACSAYS